MKNAVQFESTQILMTVHVHSRYINKFENMSENFVLLSISLHHQEQLYKFIQYKLLQKMQVCLYHCSQFLCVLSICVQQIIKFYVLQPQWLAEFFFSFRRVGFMKQKYIMHTDRLLINIHSELHFSILTTQPFKQFVDKQCF